MRLTRFYIILVTIPALLAGISIFFGRYPLTIENVFNVLFGLVLNHNVDPTHLGIVVHIRLPRIILGAMVGASLSVSGAAFQGMFRNPLVSSGMLGVSSGAGFGAALALILFDHFFWVYPFSFGFGLIAVLLCFIIGRFTSANQSITLVLGGVIVGSVFSALISFLKYVADPMDELPAIVFWLMGSLSRADYTHILVAGIPMIAGTIGLIAVKWKLNVLAMGDREAQSLGLNVKAYRLFVIICATLATAGAVCVSGVIGWIGLVVPHMGRMLTGNDNRRLIPACISIGACFLIIVDDISRLLTSSEMPLGILTSILGGPFFIYLLKKTKGRQW
ncbi:MAG TPA: ABC transporter permease [Desulfobacteraceae bacterium]|nr:ABC transporter permease [Desulfobacteraceae bacterium]